jgi:hypothetical protein
VDNLLPMQFEFIRCTIQKIRQKAGDELTQRDDQEALTSDANQAGLILTLQL